VFLYKYLKGGCVEVGAGLFSHITSNIGQEEMASRYTRGGLDWVLGKISSLIVLNHWNRLPSEVVELLSLEVFKRCVDVALKDVVQW